MSTAMQPMPAPAVSRYDQAETINTIKQTVCKGANDAQLRMFLEVCKRTGLDPFLKEIWYVPEKGIIMAGRDGYLRVANENPQFDGMETRVERDQDLKPIKAVCTVWRKDRTHAIICEAYFNEYRKDSPVWRQYPSAMISKVAEVLALKRSFAINGVVTEEEIGQGDGGSAAAAQAIAEKKLEAMRAGVPAAEVVELAQPEPPSELETQLHESIQQAKGRRKKTSGSWYDMLQSFGDLKRRYKAIGADAMYYSILKHYEYEHSSDIPKTEGGMEIARCIYKEMTIDVADREARYQIAKEAAQER